LCVPHDCHCGSPVDAQGLHSFVCKRAPGWSARHHALNDLMVCGLASAGIPATKEPLGKTRENKTNLDLLEQEIVSGSGIRWTICKSAPHPRQPHQHPTTQFFTGRMPFLQPNQQCQSTKCENVDTSMSMLTFHEFDACTHARTHTRTHTHMHARTHT